MPFETGTPHLDHTTKNKKIKKHSKALTKHTSTALEVPPSHDIQIPSTHDIVSMDVGANGRSPLRNHERETPYTKTFDEVLADFKEQIQKRHASKKISKTESKQLAKLYTLYEQYAQEKLIDVDDPAVVQNLERQMQAALDIQELDPGLIEDLNKPDIKPKEIAKKLGNLALEVGGNPKLVQSVLLAGNSILFMLVLGSGLNIGPIKNRADTFFTRIMPFMNFAYTLQMPLFGMSIVQGMFQPMIEERRVRQQFRQQQMMIHELEEQRRLMAEQNHYQQNQVDDIHTKIDAMTDAFAAVEDLQKTS